MLSLLPATPSSASRAWRQSGTLALLSGIACLLLASCALPFAKKSMKTSKTPLRTVARVDLPRYMGDWRVIANIPYFAEKGCVDSIESYALRPDGTIENWFTYRKKTFTAPQKTFKAQARVVNPQTNAEWEIKFFGLIKARYLVIDLDPEYQWAVIGHPSRKYGWVLGRDRTLPASTFEAILDRLAAQGYDPGQFVKVPQVPGA